MSEGNNDRIPSPVSEPLPPYTAPEEAMPEGRTI